MLGGWLGVWGLAGRWQSPPEWAAVLGCGVILELRWQGPKCPLAPGAHLCGGRAGRTVLRAGVPTQPRCPSTLSLYDLPCGPSQGRPQRVCSPATAPCSLAWPDLSRELPVLVLSSCLGFPICKEQPWPTQGWLAVTGALELDTVFKTIHAWATCEGC